MPLYSPPAAAGAGLETAAQIREQFIGQVLAITGDTRLLWLPKSTDTTTSTDESLNARTFTYDATIAARLAARGLGYAVSFSGTGQYATVPDAANLSFGNGTTDSAFSIVALVNTTDTANHRQILSKYQTSNTEWFFSVNSGDSLTVNLTDDSTTGTIGRTSTSTITQGAWKLFGVTYSGSAASSGLALYQDGVAIATSDASGGTYTAMEDKAGTVGLGTVLTAGTQAWQGSMALVILCQKNLSASEMWALWRLAKAYFAL